MYCVIMGDIIRSQDLSNETREKDTKAIEYILAQINFAYRDVIYSPFDIVRGDAFEGVLYTQQYSMEIIEIIIQFLLKNCDIKIRVCAASGLLDVANSDTNKSDGTAFHVAVKELELLKEKKDDHWFQVSMKLESISQPLIDSLLLLISSLTRGWTKKQREIVWAMREEEATQLEVSGRLGISANVVSKQLKSAQYETYKFALESIEKYIIQREEESILFTKKQQYTTYYSIARRESLKKHYKIAIDNYNEAIKGVINEFSKKDIRLVQIYNSLAETYLEYADYVSEKTNYHKLMVLAENAILKSLICQDSGIKKDTNYIQTLIAYGRYYWKLSDVDNTLIQFKEAYSLSRSLYDDTHPFTEACRKALGKILEVKNRLREAENYHTINYENAKKEKNINPLEYEDELFYMMLYYNRNGQMEKTMKLLESDLEMNKREVQKSGNHLIKEMQGVTC